MHVAGHPSPERLQFLADREPGKARFLRLRAVILALAGRSAPEIARALGTGRRTVQEWVEGDNAEGLDGLVDRPGRGRPCRLTPPQPVQLRRRIDAGPAPEDGACTACLGRNRCPIPQPTPNRMGLSRATYRCPRSSGLISSRD
jgi:predicted transcriptional regulator